MQSKSWLALGLCVLGGLVQAQSTSRFQTAYYAPSYGQASALLVDWFVDPNDPAQSTARLVDRDGVVAGKWWHEDGGRMLALDQPRVLDGGTTGDSCGQQVPIRITQTRFLFKTTSGYVRRGQTAVTVDEQGVMSEGCDAGKVLWKFTIADATMPHNHLLMTEAKGHADLVGGGRMAGLSEALRDGSGTVWAMPQDVTRFERGRSIVRFERTGTRVPYTQGPTGWLVLNFPWGQRGYMRLDRDTYDAEAWLMADLQDGEPKWVEEVHAVMTLRSASFGELNNTARVWQAGFTLNQPENMYVNRLFRDGSGERGTWNSLTDVGNFSPMTWRYEGANVVHRIPWGGSATEYRQRTWEPVRTVGSQQWVMEEDIVYPANGTPWTFIPRRVHLQVDLGPSQPFLAKRQTSQSLATNPAEAPKSGLRNALAPSLQVRRW